MRAASAPSPLLIKSAHKGVCYIYITPGDMYGNQSPRRTLTPGERVSGGHFFFPGGLQGWTRPPQGAIHASLSLALCLCRARIDWARGTVGSINGGAPRHNACIPGSFADLVPPAASSPGCGVWQGRSTLLSRKADLIP